MSKKAIKNGNSVSSEKTTNTEVKQNTFDPDKYLEENREPMLKWNVERDPEADWEHMDDDTFDEYVYCKDDFKLIFLDDISYREWIMLKMAFSAAHGEFFSYYGQEYFNLFIRGKYD